MFIGMLAFQLSGALVLLLNCMKGGKEAVIRNCFPGTNVVERDENNNCKIEKEKLQKSAHNIYLNIIAFADLDGVDTVPTEKEIDDICNDVFKE